MGKIVISQNVSLDGVVQDPTGEEGTRHGGWFLQVSDAERRDWAIAETAEALGAEALLLGRRSDEYFAAGWLDKTGEWADKLNTMPKYVVSSTLDKPKWSTTGAGQIITGDVVAEVAKLRQELAGEIVVYASNPLVRTLMEHDLVDELRLTVYPVVLGSGTRLFGETSDKRPLRLVSSKTLGDNLLLLTYEVTRPA